MDGTVETRLVYARYNKVGGIYHITRVPVSAGDRLHQRDLPPALCGHDFNPGKGRGSTYRRNDGYDIWRLREGPTQSRLCGICKRRLDKEAADNGSDTGNQ